MGRDWKPGDVALVTCKTPPTEFPATRDAKGWNSVDPSIGFAPDYDVVDARPLLLIDPEDREQVTRLWQAVDAQPQSDTRPLVDVLRDALRSLIATTRPDEPTGLGAVVEDEFGDLWIRSDADDDRPWCDSLSHGDGWVNYSDIAAVRVLSEGVVA